MKFPQRTSLYFKEDSGKGLCDGELCGIQHPLFSTWKFALGFCGFQGALVGQEGRLARLEGLGRFRGGDLSLC